MRWGEWQPLPHRVLVCARCVMLFLKTGIQCQAWGKHSVITVGHSWQFDLAFRRDSGGKDTHSVEIMLGILHLDLFAGWPGTVRYPVWCWAALSQLCHHKGQQPIHSRPFHTPIRILLFAFSAGFNKLHEIFNTLLYNRLCVGWSLPNHSVLSLFKMG